MSADQEKSGGRSRPEIIIAIIGLIGILGGALFANWDKVFRSTTVDESRPTQSIAPAPAEPAPRTSAAMPPGASAQDFSGVWLNQNRDTGGITRVEIDQRLNNLSIRMWGACHPTDCDWGTKTTDSSDGNDNDISITWTTNFSVIDQKLTVTRDGRLQVSGHTHFTDGTGRPDYDSTGYFVRR